MSQKPIYTSSSDDEEDSGSEDEQTSGSDSDTDSGQQPKPDPKNPLKKPLPPDLSEESSSDSDLPPKKPTNKPQPSDKIRNVDTKVVKKDTKPPPPLVPAVVGKEANKIIKQNKVNGDGISQSVNKPPKKPAAVDSTIKPVHLKKPIETKSAEKTESKRALTPVQSQTKSNKRPLTASPVFEKKEKKIKQNKVDGGSGNKLKPRGQGLSVSGSETEESGSGTDTDSDSTPKESQKVKPVDAKPMEIKSVGKTGSKAVAVKNKLSPMVSGKNESESEKKSGGQDEEAKKQLFQRLWSEDDEIVVLEGMIGYKNENGEHALADMGAFHEFIKKKLHVDVSRAQLVDKVRRLKKKYVNNASREKDGKDRSFSKSHEQKVYELSKLMWSSKGNSNSNNPTSGQESKKKNQSQKNGKLKGNAASTSTGAGASLVTSNGVDDKDKAMMEVEKNMDISRFVQYGGMSGSPIVSEEIMKAGLELVEGSKRAELEAKWRKLKEQELEIYVNRMELLREQALVILDAVRSSGN